MSDLPPTQRRTRFDALYQIGCIACKVDGRGWVEPAIHHVREYGEKRKDSKTLPLCPNHHQYPHTAEDGYEFLAVHAGRASFEIRYGGQGRLLEMVDELI